MNLFSILYELTPRLYEIAPSSLRADPSVSVNSLPNLYELTL
jgi:hypothetical protein